MKAYVGDTVEDKPHKRNSVRLAIRKVGLNTPLIRLQSVLKQSFILPIYL